MPPRPAGEDPFVGLRDPQQLLQVDAPANLRNLNAIKIERQERGGLVLEVFLALASELSSGAFRASVNECGAGVGANLVGSRREHLEVRHGPPLARNPCRHQRVRLPFAGGAGVDPSHVALEPRLESTKAGPDPLGIIAIKRRLALSHRLPGGPRDMEVRAWRRRQSGSRGVFGLRLGASGRNGRINTFGGRDIIRGHRRQAGTLVHVTLSYVSKATNGH